MAKKNNNRNIRITDQMLELIEQQVGNNFTEKWENLVTRCVWELPHVEDKLKFYNDLIEKRSKEVDRLNQQIRAMHDTIYDLRPRIEAMTNAIDRNIKKFET